MTKKADKNTKTNKAQVSKGEPVWDEPVSFTYVKHMFTKKLNLCHYLAFCGNLNHQAVDKNFCLLKGTLIIFCNESKGLKGSIICTLCVSEVFQSHMVLLVRFPKEIAMNQSQ